jgi:hypothetical protein
MAKKYVLVAEGDVFMTISFSEEQPGAPAWMAGLASSPTIVDISSHPDAEQITRGWTWDGATFNPPS